MKRKPGRPKGSPIRQNIVELLYFMGEGYGYEIHKIYNELFEPVTQESIYYNLKRGVNNEEFILKEVKIEKGEFSWGQTVEKYIYTLGSQSNPRILNEVKEFFDNRKKE